MVVQAPPLPIHTVLLRLISCATVFLDYSQLFAVLQQKGNCSMWLKLEGGTASFSKSITRTALSPAVLVTDSAVTFKK